MPLKILETDAIICPESEWEQRNRLVLENRALCTGREESEGPYEGRIGPGKRRISKGGHFITHPLATSYLI